MARKYAVTRGCTFCNTCVYECPQGAITMTARGAWIEPELCTGCGTCYNNCASEAIEAIEVENRKVSRSAVAASAIPT